MISKKLSAQDIIKEIVECNCLLHRLKHRIDYSIYEKESEEIFKALWTIYKDERVVYVLNEYESQKEELQILDSKEYENWVYKNKPHLFGFGGLPPFLTVIFEKDTSFLNKLDLFKEIIEDIPFETGNSRRHLKYKLNNVKERNFIESFVNYKDVLLQLESRHSNDINAFCMGCEGETKVKDYILSVIKNYLTDSFEITRLVNYIFFNYDYALLNLLDTISLLTKDDIILDLRLNLTDTTANERAILFLRFFKVHIMSLYNIKRLKETINN